MTKHTVGTLEEWQVAREALREREHELTRLNEELLTQRRQLPWVPVEKTYTFDTEEGSKTLEELFDGRSQLLIYHLMFGPHYSGACPGCSGLADHFDGGVVHLEHRDVTFRAVSRAPLEKLLAYKQRMGWRFPWVSAFGSDFPYDFGFAMTEEQQQSDEFRALIDNPGDWLLEWAAAIGVDIETGLIEGPGWNVFALEDGIVYHTYSRFADDGELLAPYFDQLLAQTPKGAPAGVDNLRHDEYEYHEASR